MTRKVKFAIFAVALASAVAVCSQIDFSALVEKEGAAVVNITVKRTLQSAEERSAPGPQGPGPNFGPFPFGQPSPFGQPMPNQPRAMPQAAQGSGFIIKPD